MRITLLAAFVIFNIASFAQTKSENVIMVTFDGYRWQEMFGGAQKRLYTDAKYGKDLDKLTFDYTGDDAVTRREKLMPFIWGTIGKQGSIYGNKSKGNSVRVTNIWKFSFPGYNELFSGWGDIRINKNKYGDDPNYNIFDFLKSQQGFDGKLVAIATWDAFIKIINVHRNGIPVIAGQKPNKSCGLTCSLFNVDSWETTVPNKDAFAMQDTFTYHVAKEYLKRNHPRFAFIGFDETDDFAHEGKYAAYLGAAHRLDSYMKDLWDFIQSDPQYKDKTTLIITCDHGRGDIIKSQWQHHATVPRAGNIWVAAIGPSVAAKGEVTEHQHLHQNQVAATIAQMFGLSYAADHYIGAPMAGFVKK